ncbi:hypothetical protein NG791_23780 [Laspinema sp. D1]|uniref:hypothetical protein n=1 Tax=Laspinema palackyanum TaxID=3231601 RepID=UPI0034849D0D|nr:hypothetical protein [Laspinema sp. D2b]
MPTAENERIVRAFLLLLHRESQKPESAIIPPKAWETLGELKASLAQANDDVRTLSRGITNWCREHQYSSILQALRPILSDAIPEEEDPEEDETETQILRVSNLSLRFVEETISQSQEQHQQQSS